MTGVKGENSEFFMTEEQRKCEEIINSCGKIPITCACDPDIMRITISLAKVFNKDITEEEAIDIYNKFFENISSNICISCLDTFGRIANYFDDGTSGMKPNYIINKAFEERNKNK